MSSFDDRLFDLMLEEASTKAGVDFAADLDNVYDEYSSGLEIKPSFIFRLRMWLLCRKLRTQKGFKFVNKFAAALLVFSITVSSSVVIASAFGINLPTIFERFTDIFTSAGMLVTNTEVLIDQINRDGEVCIPTYIPKGYIFDRVVCDDPSLYMIYYSNDENIDLFFQFKENDAFNSIRIDTEDAISKAIEVDGMDYARISKKGEYTSVYMFNAKWDIVIESQYLSDDIMILISKRLKFFTAKTDD